MNTDKARFKIGRLADRQRQLEREILAILNKGCLPLEEARKKMKAGGIMTETSRDGMERVVFTTPDGEKGFTDFPVWYPRYAGMDDIFESLEIDMAVVKDLKKRRAENNLTGIRNEDGDGYISAYEKVFEKAGEYRANEAKIEELTAALNSIADVGEKNTQTPDDVQKKIDATLAMLMEGRLIKKEGDEYIAIKPLPDIQTELRVKRLMGKIDYPEPELDQINDFILRYIKTENGKSSSSALRQARYIQKKKKGVT
jgi:hypothetical protein